MAEFGPQTNPYNPVQNTGTFSTPSGNGGGYNWNNFDFGAAFNLIGGAISSGLSYQANLDSLNAGQGSVFNSPYGNQNQGGNGNQNQTNTGISTTTIVMVVVLFFIIILVIGFFIMNSSKSAT